MERHNARRSRNWLWLALATVLVSAVFGTAIAFFIETLPSADPQHPLVVWRLVGEAIAFTLMVAVLFAVAIAATRYWDPRASAWEGLICLTVALIVGPTVRAAVAPFGAPGNSELLHFVALAAASGSYLLARWLYRQRHGPAPRDGQPPFGRR